MFDEIYNAAFEDELEKIAFSGSNTTVEQLYTSMAKASKSKHTPAEKKDAYCKASQASW